MKFVKPRSCLDPVLENLALSLDRGGGEVAVVLHLEGSIVAGNLIGHKQYIDLHHETMRKLVPGQQERLEATRNLALRVHNERVKVEAPPVLLLKDVVLAQGNNKIKLPLWRAPRCGIGMVFWVLGGRLFRYDRQMTFASRLARSLWTL